MRVTARKMMGNSVFAAGLILALSGFTEGDVRWKDVTAWEHSWDAADAVTYDDDGKNYDLPPALRIDHVPDGIGDRPMFRDEGTVLAAFGQPAVPGPLLQDSNPMFNGRPSWFSDTIIPHDPNKATYFYSTHSALNTVRGADDTFNWKQPWWGAVLARGVGPFVSNNRAYIDGNPGMVTIDMSVTGTVQIRAWPNGLEFGPTINSGLAFTEDTVLVMWHANGDKSWLEINYKAEDGEIVTRRVQGAISSSVMKQMHSGLSHTNYTAAVGIARGVPTAEQTDAVRNWASPYIPVALELGKEEPTKTAGKQDKKRESASAPSTTTESAPDK